MSWTVLFSGVLDESSFELKQNWHQIFLEVLKTKEESFTQEKVNFYGVGSKASKKQ
jgi:hypothetical protein